MKEHVWQVILAILVLGIGFGAGLILYPIIFVTDEIPVIVEESPNMTYLLLERNVLYTLVEQQQLMIDAYKKIVSGYDSAVRILIERYE